MSSGILSTAILQRDGSGQAQRKVPALNSSYILVEERTLEDWIAFAKQYAKELNFFTENNLPTGTWEGFLSDIDISHLIAYIENPDAFSDDDEALRKLSRPHLV